MGSHISHPRVNISLLPAAVVDSFADRRDLFVGQKLAAGTATSGALVQNVHLMTREQIEGLFGVGHLYYRVITWIAANGAYSPLDVIPLNPGGSATAATSTVTVSGTATSDGTFTVEMVDSKRFTMTISVISGQTATQVGDAIVTAVSALTRPIFSAANSTGTVTFTALDLGTIGNNYELRVTGSVAGLTLGSTVWGSGTVTPTVAASTFDPVDGIRYTGVGWPEDLAGSLSVLTGFLDPRFNASNDILDGVGFTGMTDTFANVQTAVQAQNSQSLAILARPLNAVIQPIDYAVGEFMGIRSRRLTPGAGVADFVIATLGRLDAQGGPALASMPYFNTPLANVPVELPVNFYSTTEQRTLETDGATTFGPNRAGNTTILGPAVTTFTTDSGGNVNPSFHYLNYVDTGSVCREIIYNTLRATFAQSRLTEGDLIPGRSMANAVSIKAELLRIYRTLADQALTQSGRAAESFFAEQTNVTVSLATRTVTVNGPLPIVTQVGDVNYSLQLAFSTEETGTQITF